MRKFEGNDLQDRYANDESFRKRVHSNEQEYYLLRKRANEMRPEQLIAQSFLEKFMAKDNRSIYFLYGYLVPQPGKCTTQLTLNFILNFKPESNERFSFVYFNHLTPSSEYFKEFKNIFLLLPLSILEKMDAFVLVKPSFYLKALNYLAISKTGSLFNKSYFTVENCHQLCEKLKISVHDFASFVPEEFSEEFPEKFKRSPSLQNYRVNYYGQNLTESKIFEKSQFEGTIHALISKQVYTIENYELGELGIPIILEILIFYFKGRPEGLSEEGIFRKSVSVEQEKQTFDELGKRNYEYLESITNPHLIASLIKKFFHNLKEPIITFQLFTQLMNDLGVSDKKQHLKKLVSQLPKLNFAALAFLIDFLKKDVISREKLNLMTANNIAICFSPCLMRSEVASMADFAYASKSVTYSNLLITSFDDIFGNEQQRTDLFKSNVIEHNNFFQKTIREELHFESYVEEDEVESEKPMIRPGESYTLKQDENIEDEEGKTSFIMESAIYQPFKKHVISSRKLSDKIEQISNEIKQIEQRFTQRKKSAAESAPETADLLKADVNLEEDDTVFILIQPEQEEAIQDINSSIGEYSASLSYSSTSTPNRSSLRSPQFQKVQKGSTMVRWSSLKREQ